MKSNKCLFTVCVDNYYPDIAGITIPAMQTYAKKIGADFRIISERKYPEWPATYEKMQVYELGIDYEACLLLDCDMYLTEDMYDVSEVVAPGNVGVWMQYDPSITIKEDEYLRFDGSTPILATNFLFTRRAQHELWHPLEITVEQALARMKRPFVIDEYCIGRNLIKNGYLTQGLALPGAYENLFYHGNITTDGISVKTILNKLQRLRE